MDNRRNQPLSNRPKRTDTTAVDEWLKENNATVLPSFEKKTPKEIKATKYHPRLIAKASNIIGRIQHNGLTNKQFMTMFSGVNRQDDIVKVKQILMSHFGYRLGTQTKISTNNKTVVTMTLVKLGSG